MKRFTYIFNKKDDQKPGGPSLDVSETTISAKSTSIVVGSLVTVADTSDSQNYHFMPIMAGFLKK